MIEENPYMAIGWEAISRLTHYSPQWVRKKFGGELKDSGLVVIKWIWYRDGNGKRSRKRVAVAVKNQLEHFFLSKKQAGEY